jgi:ABC-type uncharacterized transport system involved in gliding motility auxiliary subunit
MNINRKLRLQLFFQNSLFVVLLVALVIAIGYVTRNVQTQWDLTQAKRNTLSGASAEVLAEMAGPVSVTAYATTQDAEGDLRKTIVDFIAPYQRVKSDFSLTFVDPREEPDRAREAGVRLNGELVVEFGGRSENLTRLTEQDLTNLLVRLMRTSERFVMQLDGHGERRLDGRANHDLGEFGSQLNAKGFRTGAVNLAQVQDIPDNTSVLVVASPQVDLLPGEVNRLRRYLERGGNMLWLADYESLRGMEPIAEFLGLELIDGVVIDPRAGGLNLPAAFALATAYGEHRITENTSITSVFPYARQVAANEASAFHFTPLVQVAAGGGWLETDGLANAAFDRGRDIRGPIVVAGALEREVGDQRQRVAMVGTGHFLANQHIGMLGNLDFGVNMMNWLAGDESLITIQPRPRGDLTLEMSRTLMSTVALGFLVVLPAGFLVAGGLIWWRRRKS